LQQEVRPTYSTVIAWKAEIPWMVNMTRSSLRDYTLSSKLPVLVTIVCVGFACVSLSCSGDRNESFYSSLADADKAGAITHGWIPADLLPGSSRAIHEVHEISPSTEWCVFEFLPPDSQGIRKNLKSVDALPSSVKHVPSPGVSWWPPVLKGNLDVEKIHTAGFDLYVVVRPETSVTREILLFAIDWPKGRGFFYRTRESSPSSP
jgi:hypothetical protein